MKHVPPQITSKGLPHETKATFRATTVRAAAMLPVEPAPPLVETDDAAGAR